MKNRYFVTSDIHDNYTLLIKSLKDQGFDFENIHDKLIICGDAFVFGHESGKLFEFLKKLKEKDKLIFIFGNHDLNLLDNINQGHFNIHNKKCVQNIVSYYIGKFIENDVELLQKIKGIGFEKFLKETMIPYFELKNTIFVHGFIPTKNKQYVNDWRKLPIDQFKKCVTSDGMLLSMFYHVKEPGKTIVFGHYSAARCEIMKNANQVDWKNKIYKDIHKIPLSAFRPFYGDGFIAIDSSNRKSNFINVILLEVNN